MFLMSCNAILGRGVFATKAFYQGDFLLQYRGQLITETEANRREQEYNEELGSFLFYFQHDAKTEHW